VLLDGKEALPTFSDNTFSSGKVAYWTKSDAVSYFTDTKIVYTPREPLAQTIVREAMIKYPHLVGIQISMPPKPGEESRIVASSIEKDIGLPANKNDADIIKNGTIYYDKQGNVVTVAMSLHDRNGDGAAVVRVRMKFFKGQTEQNAIIRATPIVEHMQARAPAAGDWSD
jgi:hypothetical protein